MRFLSLFSGIEAASCAWKPLGWDCVAVAEVEPFPCSLLKHHYPDVPNLGDVTKITADQIDALGHIDLVCGGFPCQDLSVAGKRKGLSNADGTSTRSGLFFDAMRISDWANPRWLFIENVPGMFSSNAGRDFASVVGEMAGCEFDVPRNGWRNAGVVIGPRGLVEWSVMDAQYHGLAQRRKRVFIVRDSGDWSNRPPIFLESYRMQGHPAPRRQAGQRPTGTLSARTEGGGGLGTDFELGGGLVPAPHATISPALKARDGKGPSSDGDGAMGIAVCAAFKGGQGSSAGGIGYEEELSPTLTSADSGSNRVPILMAPVALPGRMSGTQCASTENLAPSMGALNPTAVSVNIYGGNKRAGRPNGGFYAKLDEETSKTLDAATGLNPTCSQGGTAVLVPSMAVRKLTPVECEKLQGFPNITENIKVEICFDRQKSVVNVAIKCLKSQSSASNAGASESHQPANTADRHSSTSQVCREPLVALHVLQQSEGRTLELRSAKKLIMSASTAGKQNVSPLCMQAESFAAVLVQVRRTLALTTPIGKVASHQNISLSLTEVSGNQSAKTSGGVTEECANGAAPDVSKAKFTISSLGHVTVSCDSPIATLLCSVMTATSGFTQSGILPETFSVELTTEAGYTAVPHRGKPAADGNRYKALGNSWAVPNVTWIGRRIDLVNSIRLQGQKPASRIEEVGMPPSQANDGRERALLGS